MVITDAFWHRQFKGEDRAIGSTVKFSDRVFTIVGVLPPAIRYPGRADIYVASAIQPETASRSGHNHRVIARLKPDVTVAQAHAEMESIARALEKQYPDSNTQKLAPVVALQELMVGPVRNPLYMLLGAVGLVLLIACANVANLLLARPAFSSVSRQRCRSHASSSLMDYAREAKDLRLALAAAGHAASSWWRKWHSPSFSSSVRPSWRAVWLPSARSTSVSPPSTCWCFRRRFRSRRFRRPARASFLPRRDR
ncbi:MAG: ABC transporter permease [Vicinamibacterales bacterium]